MLLRAVALPGASEKLPETGIAVRNERAQPEFLGKDERLPVRRLGFLKIWGIAVREEGTDEAEPAGFSFPLVELASDFERALSEPRGFVRTGEEQIGAAEKQE